MKKAHSLIDKVSSIRNLSIAFRNGSKRGGSPGPDGTSWDDYSVKLASNLTSLSYRLRTGTFFFKQPRVRLIKTYHRFPLKVHISNVEDRVVQHALKQTLTAILDPYFLEVSYGYRKRRGSSQASARLFEMLMNLSDPHLFSIDIQNCYASIDMARLKRAFCRYIADGKVIMLVEQALNAPSNTGLPPGNVLSTLMTDLYLLDLDRHLSLNRMIRYCDNVVGLAASAQEAESDINKINEALGAIGLQANVHKTKLVYPVEFFSHKRVLEDFLLNHM